ncbi:MAG: SIMPL domain-containing protein [Acidobacteria bacterium]|nr:SIMPL domain-containing protein [Acidobacteriota bacterium]
MRLISVFACVFLIQTAGLAQTSAGRVVRATGQAMASVKPDQVKINVGVVTQAETAQAAASQNATQVAAVLNQLRPMLGAGSDLQTVGYSITPNYRYPQGQPAVLTGYTATNMVQVTTSDLSIIGKVIDTASQAGANSVQSLRFGIKDEDPVRSLVLGMAAKQARAHAEAIAGGLGARIGGVITAQEGIAVSPLTVDNRTVAAASPTTPIETGLVTVSATVTVDVELIL